MSKLIEFAACVVAATTLLAQMTITPMNLKPGYWQNTITTTAAGKAPRTRTVKFCVTQKDLNSNPFGKTEQGDGMTCQDRVIRSTATDLEMEVTCTGGTSGSDIHTTAHLTDSEHVTGHNEMTVKMNGRTIQSSAKSEETWIGATCPAGRN